MLAHSPSIVTNGLVLCLDAGNTKSYDKYENLLSNTSTAAAWGVASATNETTYPILGLNTVRVTDLSTDGDSPHLNGTSISVGTYTVSHYIDTVNSTCSTFTFALFTFHADSGGFVFSYVNSAFTLNTKTFGSFTYYGPAWSNATATATNVGGGIYRLSITATTSLNGTGIRAYITPSPIDTSYVIIAGSQYERGSSATDYYQTTGTAKTRGTTWTDLSGQGNTGTLTNGPTYSSSNGGSIVFDGTDDIVSTILNQTTFGSSGFTFNLALNVTDDGATDVRRALLGNTNFTVDGFGFGFNHDLSNTNKWNITFYPSYNIVNFDSYTPNFGNNEFITLWYNGTDTIRLYRNGELLSSLSVPNTKTYRNANVLIGTFNQGGWSSFLGKIYLVQAYNRALSSQEIQQNFNALRSRFSI